ncbi:MAG: succinate dehydrogenase iron-sulfur subunit [Candidatus Caenarcaniphilales bacterium]|jgi:succinate dehydrogenase / fumarate reductase iron-sulfur subunit|nr:succinate dehydrogenase iron-sulfur subunit [Candidatus Caenarcaniphilales bacterium]
MAEKIQGKTVNFKVKRQKDQESKSYYENFEVPYEQGMNVISILMATKQFPQTQEGTATEPVCYESGCLEEVCGSCTMVINGKVRQACSAIVDNLEQPITIEPMSKFPVQRDLIVDRSNMFEALKKVKAWIAIDGIYDLGDGPKVLPEIQEENYILSRCMTCGCCLEVCPQWTNDNGFIGAQAISQAVLFNSHPNGASLKNDRTQALIENGLADCGNAQACVKACPKEIPLTDSIARANRMATGHSISEILRH